MEKIEKIFFRNFFDRNVGNARNNNSAEKNFGFDPIKIYFDTLQKSTQKRHFSKNSKIFKEKRFLDPIFCSQTVFEVEKNDFQQALYRFSCKNNAKSRCDALRHVA